MFGNQFCVICKHEAARMELRFSDAYGNKHFDTPLPPSKKLHIYNYDHHMYLSIAAHVMFLFGTSSIFFDRPTKPS